jgi:hypothetical protein
MEELRSEADVPLWAYSGIQAKCSEPVPVTTFGQNTVSTMWIIPDTHGIVSVEFLNELLCDAYLHSDESSSALQLCAIIDNKENTCKS